MKEKLKEPRIWLCAVFYILAILPWISLSVKTEAAGASASASASVSGYSAMVHSLIGIILLLIPAALIALEFLDQIQLPRRLFYLGGSVLGIVITFLSGLLGAGGAKAGADAGAEIAGSVEVKSESSSGFGIGLWLTLVVFLAILVYTIIKDFAINKDTLKEQGIKGAFTNVAGSVTKDASQSMDQLGQGGVMPAFASAVCPQCGKAVLKGKKFCNKCGAKLDVSADDASAAPNAQPQTMSGSTAQAKEAAGKKGVSSGAPSQSVKSQRGAASKTANPVMTVRQYIATLGSITCSSCGERVDANKKFCPNCGETIVVTVFPDKCEQCGGDIVQGKKFCPDCGAEIKPRALQTNCSKCNAELVYGKKFCVECGEKIEG